MATRCLSLDRNGAVAQRDNAPIAEGGGGSSWNPRLRCSSPLPSALPLHCPAPRSVPDQRLSTTGNARKRAGVLQSAASRSRTLRGYRQHSLYDHLSKLYIFAKRPATSQLRSRRSLLTQLTQKGVMCTSIILRRCSAQALSPQGGVSAQRAPGEKK